MQNWVRLGLPGAAVVVLATGCDVFDDDDRSPAAGDAAAVSAARAEPSSTGSTEEPPVNAQEAQDIALEAVGGGWILKTEAEDRDDVVLVWEVTVVAPTGEHREVSVDMGDGSVLANVVDD